MSQPTLSLNEMIAVMKIRLDQLIPARDAKDESFLTSQFGCINSLLDNIKEEAARDIGTHKDLFKEKFWDGEQ
jgi:hypothetical protein